MLICSDFHVSCDKQLTEPLVSPAQMNFGVCRRIAIPGSFTSNCNKENTNIKTKKNKT